MSSIHPESQPGSQLGSLKETPSFPWFLRELGLKQQRRITMKGMDGLTYILRVRFKGAGKGGMEERVFAKSSEHLREGQTYLQILSSFFFVTIY